MLAAVCVALFPVISQAGEFTFAGLRFSLADDGAYVGRNAEAEGNVTIPESVEYGGETYPVVGISDGAFEGSLLTFVSIPGSVKTIGSEAFSHCRNLNIVTVSDGVAHIGGDAFAGCRALTDVIIGKDVTFIDSGAFNGLTSIVNFVLLPGDSPVTLGDAGAFGGTPVKNLSLGRQIDGSMFLQSALETVEFLGGCRTVSGFDKAPMLKKVYFSENVDLISEGAFAVSSRITDVICGNEFPPVLEESAFMVYAYRDAMLNVPEGSEEAYHTAQEWSRFAMINGSYASVPSHDEEDSFVVYTVSGMPVKSVTTPEDLQSVPAGIYIVGGRKINWLPR